ASQRCAEVPGFSTTPGTALDLWDCNGGGNQSWNLTADNQLQIYGNLCMQAGTDGVTAAPGSAVVLADCTGAATQQWSFTSDG
ncbi:ricin-type beta-trefoil lectin domain protein, partial [Priestia sp. SIMBA_032]